MESKKFFVFMVLLFLFASGSMMTTEARMCMSKSSSLRFRPCYSDGDCARHCESEHFPDGKCEGLRRRCNCYTPC